MKIAVDIDDVLADSTDALRLFVNQRHGIELSREHYKIEAEYWGYYERVLEQHGIDPTDIMKDFHGGMVLSQADIEPVPGAVTGIQKLSAKHEIVLITSRPGEMEGETKEWLKLHIEPVPEEVIFLGFGAHARKTKGEACNELGVEYLIDDNINHCVGAQTLGVKAILFGEYGWHTRIPDSLVRCTNWPQAEEFFGL